MKKLDKLETDLKSDLKHLLDESDNSNQNIDTMTQNTSYPEYTQEYTQEYTEEYPQVEYPLNNCFNYLDDIGQPEQYPYGCIHHAPNSVASYVVFFFNFFLFTIYNFLQN